MKITYKELLERVDASKAEKFWHIDDLQNDLSLNHLDIDGQDPTLDKLKHVFVHSWYCTDTWVGLGVLFIEDTPVAITYQPGRKYDVQFQFVSIKAAEDVSEILKVSSINRVYYDILNLEEGVEEDIELVNLKENTR